MLSLVLLLVTFRKHGVGTIVFFLPTFFNQITYLLVTASQDTRYTYINYTIFVILLALALTKSIKSSSNKVIEVKSENKINLRIQNILISLQD